MSDTENTKECIAERIRKQICTEVLRGLSDSEVDDVFQKLKAENDSLHARLESAEAERDDLVEAVQNWERETEYDGKMELYCHFCGTYQDTRNGQHDVHSDDCVALKYGAKHQQGEGG